MKREFILKVKDEVISGTSMCTGNPWKRQGLVLEFVDESNWTQRMKVDVFNDTVDALADVEVESRIVLNITFRTEYRNGKVYNNITATCEK